VYAERLGVLLEEGRRELGGVLELSEVEAGLQTIGWLQGVSSDAAAEAARARGVDVTALRGTRLPGLQLGFAAVRGPEIRRGVRELRAALGSLRRWIRFFTPESAETAEPGAGGWFTTKAQRARGKCRGACKLCRTLPACWAVIFF
jgi:hypothetical protein